MTQMPPIAVIAGGLGTRLYPITETIPKSLVEVSGKPFVVHQLELFAKRGITEVVFCVGHLGEQIEDLVKDGSRFGLKIRFSYDGKTLCGTGGALRRALPLLGNEFMVTYGDSYLDVAYDAVLAAFHMNSMPALMTVFNNQNHWGRSNVEFKNNRILIYDKNNHTPRMHFIDYGLLVMKPHAFIDWKEMETFDLADLLGQLANTGRLAGLEITTRFYEIGSPTGIADLTAYLATI